MSLPSNVTIAPLVLLSVLDHFTRVSKDGKKRVVGVVLGEKLDAQVGTESTYKVTNSFAVPFEEDPRNPDIWYLDHNFVEVMQDMFKKINAKERLIGWYHSGPKLRGCDMAINDVFKRYTSDPLLLIVDVDPSPVGIPTKAYFAIDEVKADGTSSGRTFKHVPSDVKAEDAEEIGVEHLLRDVRNAAAGTLATKIAAQLSSLEGLNGKLRDIGRYLERVLKGELPVNHAILAELQNVFNLMPNLSSTNNPELENAFTEKTNDQLMVVYLSSLVRAIISFHDMIDNKLENKKKLGLLNTPKEKSVEEGKEKEKAKESLETAAEK